MTCELCSLISQGNLVYHDEKTVALFSDAPMSKGHLIVAPKEHYEKIEQIPDDLIAHLYYVASFAASAIFEYFGGGQGLGTNIVTNEGKGSDRRFAHLAIDVVPRESNDGVNYHWEPQQGDKQELQDLQKKIKDETFFIGQTPQKQPTPEAGPQQESEKEEESGEKEAINYMIRQLDRCP